MEDILVPEVKGTIQSNHLRKKKQNSSHRSAEKSPTQTMHPVDPPPSLGVPHLTSPRAPKFLNSRNEFSGLPTFLFHGSCCGSDVEIQTQATSFVSFVHPYSTATASTLCQSFMRYLHLVPLLRDRFTILSLTVAFFLLVSSHISAS